jgi:MoaA/NifB/PqqE/SkfB family radical SAM enzyme
MRLEEIGFRTLTDVRCAQASPTSPLARCELVLTSRCNFRCPYCRHTGGTDSDPKEASDTIKVWAKHGLKSARFSGGEPTLWKHLPELISYTREFGIKEIAVSTNGAADTHLYENLISRGVNNFSVSLDACCAEDGDQMSGGIKGAWDHVVTNIRELSRRVYTTVGIVLTSDNEKSALSIVRFAAELDVSDIRIIPAAQHNRSLAVSPLSSDLKRFPILRYRWRRLSQNLPVRGLTPNDSNRCALVLDDMAANHGEHYPCIIYMREGGSPIGKIGPKIREERNHWFHEHKSDLDPICLKNCLDVCVAYNNRFREINPYAKR